MSPGFHFDLGPFVLDVQLDESGIHLQRGPRQQVILWERVTGATLIRSEHSSGSGDGLDDRDVQRAAQFLGAEAAQKVRALKGHVGQISVAYRNERNSLQEIQIPAPLDDPAFLAEFPARLGKRWLGESRDSAHATKQLHTAPGFFKTIFIMVTLFGVLAVVLVVLLGAGLFGLLGPVLNLLSIQKMLLDLQDGNLVSFGYRAASYAALFVLGYFLHRVLRDQWAAYRARRFPRFPARP
jgi:hypothetical protein